MKKYLLLWIACVAVIHTSYAQSNRDMVSKSFPFWGIKTKLLYDAGTTLNIPNTGCIRQLQPLDIQ